jgi:hypothetical protein
VDHVPVIDRAATAKRRIAVLFSAWQYVARKLQGWLRQVRKGRGGAGAEGMAHFSRWFEWTIGGHDGRRGDGGGHPHLHIWLFGPYLPAVDGLVRASGPVRPGSAPPRALGRVSIVRVWWSEALARAGIEIAPDETIIKLRSVKVRTVEIVRELQKGWQVTEKRVRLESVAGEDLAGYVEGWCIAALDPTTMEVAGEEVIAAVYEALEGRRLSQASAGFLSLAETLAVTCRGCGEAHFGARVIVPWHRAVPGSLESIPVRPPPELPALPPLTAGPSVARASPALGIGSMSVREWHELLDLAAWDCRTRERRHGWRRA